jgi:hypothetical protein
VQQAGEQEVADRRFAAGEGASRQGDAEGIAAVDPLACRGTAIERPAGEEAFHSACAISPRRRRHHPHGAAAKSRIASPLITRTRVDEKLNGIAGFDSLIADADIDHKRVARVAGGEGE